MSKCTHSHTHGQTHELIIKDLEVAYRHNRVLEDINLHAYCGTSLALVGPNGAGKSTLLKAIAGLHFVSFGSCASTVSSGADSGSLLTASAA